MAKLRNEQSDVSSTQYGRLPLDGAPQVVRPNVYVCAENELMHSLFFEKLAHILSDPETSARHWAAVSLAREIKTSLIAP